MIKRSAAMIIIAIMATPLAHADINISGRITPNIIKDRSLVIFNDWGGSFLHLDWIKDDLFMRASANISPIFDTHLNNTIYRNPGIYFGMKLGGGKLMFGAMPGAVKNLEEDKYLGTFLELRGAAIRGGRYGSGDARGGQEFVGGILAYMIRYGDVDFNVQYAPTDVPYSNNGAMAIGIKGKFGYLGYWFGWNNGDNNGGVLPIAGMLKAGVSIKYGDISAKLGYDAVNGSPARYFVGADISMGDNLSFDAAYAPLGADGITSYYRVAIAKKRIDGSMFYVGYISNGSYSIPADNKYIGIGAIINF